MCSRRRASACTGGRSSSASSRSGVTSSLSFRIWNASSTDIIEDHRGRTMRFTVKAKLASAFGAVIILSMITGAIAYVKLSALDASQERVVAQAGRLKQAADLMDAIQGQQRAETRMIYAASDKEIQDSYNAMTGRRDKTLKIREDLYGKASETGKQMLDNAVARMKRMNELQEQVGKLMLSTTNKE